MTTSIENRPIIVDLGFDTDPLKPILSFALDVSQTKCADKHCHPRAQLIFSSKGTMKVATQKSIWYVGQHQAIWVPSMQEHQVIFLNNNHIRNIFVCPKRAQGLPQNIFALSVSPFMRELLLKIVGIGNHYDINSSKGRLVNVLLDELELVTPTPCCLPLSDDFHLEPVINELIKYPGDPNGIEYFAKIACTSPRNLSRLFIKELGLSFSSWRKQLKLVTAVELLNKGLSVSEISFELGYNSPSAFVEMFRKAFGVPPGKYSGQL